MRLEMRGGGWLVAAAETSTTGDLSGSSLPTPPPCDEPDAEDAEWFSLRDELECTRCMAARGPAAALVFCMGRGPGNLNRQLLWGLRLKLDCTSALAWQGKSWLHSGGRPRRLHLSPLCTVRDYPRTIPALFPLPRNGWRQGRLTAHGSSEFISYVGTSGTGWQRRGAGCSWETEGY